MKTEQVIRTYRGKDGTYVHAADVVRFLMQYGSKPDAGWEDLLSAFCRGPGFDL